MVKLVDNMVQNYLGNVRRVVQRMTNLVGNTRTNVKVNQPRNSPSDLDQESHFMATKESILNQAKSLTKRMQSFNVEWAQLVGRQQSPLIDRIPPRGVEIWRDFWETVRRQVRRINQEFVQLSQDMSRVLSGRVPSNQNIQIPSLYADGESFRDFYEKMTSTLVAEQKKLDKLSGGQSVAESKSDQSSNYIDEYDDENTKEELKRNVALRQQIEQEINVFGSIFDIMRTFMQRLRESATGAIKDMLRPGQSIDNNNDSVTPGSAIRPQVEKVVDETIESQRLINSQAKPVLLPNSRPALPSRP